MPRSRRWELGIFAGILILAAGLIFFRLTRADVQTDAGHYALRAVGYLDFLDSDRQTTPFQWFASTTPPLWTRLSLHDHPPLVFGIQHGFFRMFGVNDWVAVLPFAIAGLVSVALTYLIGRTLGGPAVGLLGAGLLAVAAFFTWSSRIGYLEGVENAFILMAVWLFLRARADPRFLPVWGAGLGLALLTKYSALFLLPAFFLVVWWDRRAWFKDQRFWWSVALAAVVVSPVVVYNLKMWQMTGHLDVQWSSVIPGMREAANRDWPLFFSGPRTTSPLTNLRDLWRTLVGAFSLPFAWLLLYSALALPVLRLRRPLRFGEGFIGIGLGFLVAFFTLTAPSHRYLPILVPWLALAAALGLTGLWAALPHHGYRWRVVAVITCAAVVVSELLFNYNTNHAWAAAGQVGRDYAAYRQERLGFQELREYLEPRLRQNPTYQSAISVPQRFVDYRVLRLSPGRDVLLYDDGLLWFAAVWYLRRERLYHQLVAVLQYADLVSTGVLDRWQKFFTDAGTRTLYFVEGRNPAVYDPWARAVGPSLKSHEFAAELDQLLSAGVSGKVTEIRTRDGQPAFRVYEIPLNP